MSVSFSLATKTKVDVFRDTASIGDVVKYEIDCTPWQDDNDTITAAAWTNEDGVNAAITNPQLVAGVVSAFVNFTQAGRNRIKITLTTATRTKVMWLEVKVNDPSRCDDGDDYGLGS